jgi:hypothetical protein
MRSSETAHEEPQRVLLCSGGRPQACIVLTEVDNTAERDAARELARYLSLITGARFQCAIGSPCEGLWPIVVGSGELASQIMEQASLSLAGRGEEAFAVGVTGQGIVLKGVRARSTYYAVYSFLEKLGCRFLEPGPDGEVIPHREHLCVDVAGAVDEPALPYRNVNLDCTNWPGLQHEIDIIEWTLKNRGNMVEMVPFHMDGQRLIGHFAFLLDEIKRRDLLAGFGGHGVGMFFILPHDCLFPGKRPRDFADFVRLVNQTKIDEPDLFGAALDPIVETNGEALFCMSNPRSRERFIGGVIAFLKAYPGVDSIRFGQNDRCRPCPCDRCRDQRVANYFGHLLPELGSELRRVFPEKTFVSMLQGHGDAWCLDEAEIAEMRRLVQQIPSNIIFCIGNENFDFRGDISEPCNHTNFSRIQNHQAVLASHRYITKEMYGSGLYARIPFWTPRVVWRSTRYYARNLPNYAGTHVFINPTTTWRVWSPNLGTFLRVMWDPDLDIDRLVDDYVDHAYAGAQELGRRIFRLFEQSGPWVAVFMNATSYRRLEVLADPSVQWAALLTDCVAETRDLIKAIDSEIEMQPRGFLAAWLGKDKACLCHFGVHCHWLLGLLTKMGIDADHQVHWDAERVAELRQHAIASRPEFRLEELYEAGGEAVCPELMPSPLQPPEQGAP